MVNMIAHAKLALDDAGNAPLGPNIANKAVAFCTAQQQVGQALALLLGQFGCRSRAWLLAQRLNSTCFSTREPLADRSCADTQSSGNLLLRPALLIQFPSAQAPSFAPISWLW